MNEMSHYNKINILKALAIMLVVSGHLEFSLIPLFPPYSFQLALFFFISGMLFNDKYGFIQYTKKRFKSLLVPYFLYALLVSYHHLYDFLKLCNKNQMYNFSIISKLNKTLRLTF